MTSSGHRGLQAHMWRTDTHTAKITTHIYCSKGTSLGTVVTWWLVYRKKEEDSLMESQRKQVLHDRKSWGLWELQQTLGTWK